MTTLDQMAQVLEDAADLYQAEKVNWCAGSWYKDHNGDCGGSNLKPGSPLSVCASTALGMAAGLGVLVPEFLEDNGMLGRPDKGTTEDEHWGWAYVWTEEDVQRYKNTRALLEGRLEQRYGVAYLPEFNDETELSSGGGERIPVPVRTKQEIIDLFKNTAKELRNGDQD